MATSGTVTYNLTRDEIIKDAFYTLNAYTPFDTIPAQDIAYAATQLNKMVTHWQAQGIHLWTKTEAALFLELNQATYTLTSTGANATESYVQTTIGSNEAIGQTILTVASTSGMLVNDHIGIQLDSGNLQWTTISSITNATTVVIAAPLTDSAASGNVVYVYTTKINRPLEIYSGRRNSSGLIDTPLWKFSYQEYFDLPNKTAQGVPTGFAYNPQRQIGLLYLWPTPSTVTDVIKFTFARPLQTFDIASNTPDFPQEWLEVLTLNLAVRLSYRFGKRNSIQALKNDADMALQELLMWDNEDNSISLQPSEY